MIFYFVMAFIFMVAALATHIYIAEPEDGFDYAIGILVSFLAGALWPLTLVISMVFFGAQGVLALLAHLKIIDRWK